jgi:hypothetical protein
MSKTLSEKQNASSPNPILQAATLRLIEQRRAEGAGDAVSLAQQAGLSPDPWQANVLRSTSHQDILLVSRQGGKSTVTSIRALHKALYNAGALVLLLAPSYRQSKELFRKVKTAYAAVRAGVRVRSESTQEMELENGSRIVALPGEEETIRGFSGVDLLINDEASRVSDALYYSVRPMLAVSGGDIMLLSTPFGKRGFFFEEWTSGADWLKVKVTAYQCPRISREWLEAERKAIGEWWFAQEYLCEFVDTTDQVFSYEDVMRAVTSEVKPLFGGLEL